MTAEKTSAADGSEDTGHGPKARGRDAVKAALLAAAGELFAERGPSAVSLRDIASRARVNHGLIHRHFGSKEGLLRETLESMAASIADQVAAAKAADGPRLPSLEMIVGRSPYWRILARLLLDGLPVSEIQSRFPVIEQMLADRGVEPGDAGRETRLEIASLIAISLGWLVFEPFIVEAAGLASEDSEILGRDILAKIAGPSRSS